MQTPLSFLNKTILSFFIEIFKLLRLLYDVIELLLEVDVLGSELRDLFVLRVVWDRNDEALVEVVDQILDFNDALQEGLIKGSLSSLFHSFSFSFFHSFCFCFSFLFPLFSFRPPSSYLGFS